MEGVPALSAAPLPNIHVRGTIASVTANALTVNTNRGTVTLGLAPETKIVEALPASRSDIKPNSFLGVTNIPGPNNAQAVGVLLLPDAFRNAPANAGWDWPGSGSGSSMTNGTVELASHMTNGTVAPVSHMTNGTVSAAPGSGPLTVTLNYTSQSGSELMTIPANAPVTRITFSNRSALKTGSHLFVFAANNNGQLGAAIIVVGAPGVTPPM
ncbi:MAG TPA: hypothetical protein VKB39_05280 [Candidatus Baltobacteraceae bacterium]|nr:hypothetical protein [Candidatus Baltobacteraceae bacterium]